MSTAPTSKNKIYLATLVLSALLVRLYDIAGPLWGKHGWRQADVSMVARNFYRHGYNLFYPQVDWAGPHPGFVGMEFPLVPYLTALLYGAFGEHPAWGRLVSIGFFMASLVPFYRLVERYSEESTARWALFFFIFSPLSLYYTRVTMTDSSVLSLSVLAVYFFSRWIDKEHKTDLVLATLASCLAALAKAPAAVIALPMAHLGMKKWGLDFWQKASTWLMIGAVLVSGALWYSHASHLADRYPPYEMFGELFWGVQPMVSALTNPYDLKRLVVQATALLLSPVGMLLAIYGLTRAGEVLTSRLFQWWGLGFSIVLLLGLKGQSIHEYYQLLSLPFMATFAAVGCTMLVRSKPRLQPLLILIVLVPSILLAATRFQGPSSLVYYRAGLQAAGTLPQDALVVSWDGGNPLLLYSADRRGWNFPRRPRTARRQAVSISPEEMPVVLEQLRSQGATHFVGPKRRPEESVGPLGRLAGILIGPPPEVGFDQSSDLGRYLDEHYEKLLDHQDAVIYSLVSSK